MCRWLAYAGPSVTLDVLLSKPEHSLLDQSRHARLNEIDGELLTTNGDGFGVGWYGRAVEPGLFRDVRPAWGNQNLASLAAHCRSRLFLAHLRAASAGAVQESNCHPFRQGRWLFQHNGGVGNYSKVRRALQMEIAPELYPELSGTTDSETCFLLALTYGLERDVPRALARMIQQIETRQREQDLPIENSFSCAVSDGRSIWALRHASSGSEPPSLYVSRHCKALRELHACYEAFPEEGRVLVSEPLDDLEKHWQEVPASSLVHIQRGEAKVTPFSAATA
jgi:glutamine amidotransferase